MNYSTQFQLELALLIHPELELEELFMRLRNSRQKVSAFLKPSKNSSGLAESPTKGRIGVPPPGFSEAIRGVYLDEKTVCKTSSQISEEVFAGFYPLQSVGRFLNSPGLPHLVKKRIISGISHYTFDFTA